ncbi:MAG: peptidyl-prolyl cis-trans isomerase [Melioribacteraceae bacterium]|nr:peptidyl-prolyl cis-trans isomerase [Melioribacteraceae bacterium]
MNIPRFQVLLFALLVLFISSGCESGKFPDSNIVARYDNNYYVTVDELNKYVQEWLYYKKFLDRSDVYNNALNDMLVNQFKRMDFFEKGLDKDTNLVQKINRVINEELVAEYFESQYLGKYANEEYAKKAYGIMNREVVYQLIALNKPENSSQQQLDSLKEKALAIKAEIDNGADFSSLVQMYSQNKTSLMNSGYMPPIDWKQSISNPVVGVIFDLNKNDVRVLNAINAFLIVKIADINEIHVEPYDLIKDKIISDLKTAYANTSLDEYEKDKKALIDENSLKWNEEALKQIVKWSKVRNFYSGEYRDTFADAIEKGENKIILTYNGGILDYRELLRLLNNILILAESENIDDNDIKKYILEAIRTDLIVKKADSLDLKKNIFNAFTTNSTLRNQIVYLYNQAEVEAKIPAATDEALQRFFKANESTMYYQLEKRNIFVMVFPSKTDAEKVSAEINNGTSFEDVTGKYLVKTYIKERDGEIKSYLSNEEPTFGELAFEMDESEVSGPIEFKDENDKTKYAIIKCYHIRQEKQLTFNEVKDSIKEDFSNYHRKIIEKEVEDKLKSKYHPEINDEVLAKIISPQ